jgi:hypothetical protein
MVRRQGSLHLHDDGAYDRPPSLEDHFDYKNMKTSKAPKPWVYTSHIVVKGETDHTRKGILAHKLEKALV